MACALTTVPRSLLVISVAALLLVRLVTGGKLSRKWSDKWRETNEVAGESLLGECLTEITSVIEFSYIPLDWGEYDSM